MTSVHSRLSQMVEIYRRRVSQQEERFSRMPISRATFDGLERDFLAVLEVVGIVAEAIEVGAASVDRSGEADETRSGSAEGESAVPAQQGDAHPSTPES